MQQWYALHTKIYAEQKAARDLGRHGIETYLPEINTREGKSSERRVAFFPGYLFMNVDLSATSASHWRWATGVRHIVTHGEIPVAIPAEIIGYIRRQIDEHEATSSTQTRHRFKKGDQVRIAAGPFADMVATFEGHESASERVTVLTEFLGRLSRIRVDLDTLEETGPKDGPGSPEKRRRRTRGRGRRIQYAD